MVTVALLTKVGVEAKHLVCDLRFTDTTFLAQACHRMTEGSISAQHRIIVIIGGGGGSIHNLWK